MNEVNRPGDRMKTRINRAIWDSALLALLALLLMTAGAAAEPTPGPITVSLPEDTFDISVPVDAYLKEPLMTTDIDPAAGYTSFHGDFKFDSAVVTIAPPYVMGAGLTHYNWNVTGTILNSGPGTMKTLRIIGLLN